MSTIIIKADNKKRENYYGIGKKNGSQCIIRERRTI
jgi:hypothetical protein